ncbi:MAG: hypothetical protein M3Z04_21115 [Chloroflexota bacterium]|nr:hypothetical protein [Chloroflexota bacterium]
MRGFIRPVLAPVVAGVVLLALGLFGIKPLLEHPHAAVPGVVLHDVQSITDLRDRFNQDQGVPRLVLLLSPT